MPTNNNKVFSIIKIATWVIVGAVIIGSLIFQDNLLGEMSWSTRIILILLAIGTLFLGNKKEYFPSPMELQFYDEYLIFYLPKRYYSKRVTRKQINKMMYTDIEKCVYKSKSKRVHIYGGGESIWYNYDKNGNVPLQPDEIRKVSHGLVYFNTTFAVEIDFVKEIEEHSPLRVIVENT